MYRGHVCLKGLTPVSERIVIDLQTLSRAVSGTISPSIDRLEKQVTRSLSEFSPRQLSVSLNSIARGRLFEKSQRRRIVLMMCEQLAAKSSQLTLKDFALILNALSKLGIRNEMFLTNSINTIVRKLTGMAASGNVNTSAASLILDAYSRLGFYGDGKVIEACIITLRENTDKATGIDSLIAIRALARLPEGTIRQIANLDDLIVSLLVLIEDPAHLISAFVGLSKLTPNVPALVSNTCVRSLLTQTAGQLGSAEFFRMVQFLNAVAILDPVLAVNVANDTLLPRLTEPQWTEQCDDPSSVAILLISAVTRIHERLQTNVLTSIIASMESVPLDPTGVGMLVNLCACINLELDTGLMDRLSGALPSIAQSPQSVSLVINALAKLDCIELLVQLLGSIGDIRSTVRGMTEQGQLVSLLAIAQSADRQSCGLLNLWISVLSTEVAHRSKCRESLSQLRLISVLLGNKDLLPKNSVMESRDASVVSGFHKDVLQSLTQVLDEPGPKLIINHIEPTTGYEIDIFIDIHR